MTNPYLIMEAKRTDDLTIVCQECRNMFTFSATVKGNLDFKIDKGILLRGFDIIDFDEKSLCSCSDKSSRPWKIWLFFPNHQNKTTIQDIIDLQKSQEDVYQHPIYQHPQLKD